MVKPAAEQKSVMVHWYGRLTPSESTRLKQFLTDRGLGISTFMRMVVARALRDGNLNFIVTESAPVHKEDVKQP